MMLLTLPTSSRAAEKKADPVHPQADTGILPRVEPGFANSERATHFQELCPSVRIEGLRRFKFQEMEKRLLCGDANQDPIGVPWAKIPPGEAAYFLRGFFQARGFHELNLLQDQNVLFASPGAPIRLKKLSIDGGPISWDPPKRRLIDDVILTPQVLDEQESWATTLIKNEGYACAKAHAVAAVPAGEVKVVLTAGLAKTIAGFEDRGDSGLRPGVLDRYNAFKVGDLYRDSLVQLTRRRTKDDGFLQTYSMAPRCLPDEGDRVTIVRDTVLGPSRTIRVGAGASTDLGARFRAVVRRNRIGEEASSAQARAEASYLNTEVNRQVVDANYRWYYAPGEARSYIEPSISYDHDSEVAFEARTFESRILHGWNEETPEGQFEIRAGPTYDNTLLARGTGPASSAIVYAELTARLTSHDFEYYNTSPRSGGQIEATALLTLDRWGAPFTAQKFQLQGEKLWSIFHYDPPLLILGTRFNLSSIFSPNDDPSANLPLRFLTFLGGDQDLRGFDRASLPRSGVGALSGASLGIEGRFHKVIWRRLDPFTFVDAGALGGAHFALQLPYFISPGTGLRWESPVGVLRIFVALRMAIQERADQDAYGRSLRVGFTYGEEF